MCGNQIFNAAVCIIGIAIVLIHVINLVLKKNKRKDENTLLAFLSFTVIHFVTYLTYVLVKVIYTSNAYVISFYTIFYIFNNIEVFLFFLYVLSYISFNQKHYRFLSILNYSLLGIFVILDIVNVFTGIFFTAIDGEYVRSGMMIFSQGYQFILLGITAVIALFHKKLVLGEKVALTTYCLLPLVAILFQNAFKGYAIAYLSIIIAIEVLFFFVNVNKNMQLAEEKEKNKEAQIKIMMSQIQPHFIYNSLSSISTLINIDPKKAQEALDHFTEYLRHNLSSLTETKLIPFEDELKHIKTYVALEKVRFNDRVNIIYDIQEKDFDVPALSVQPIVENAIKHGILKKIQGGEILFKTYQTKTAYIVEVIDDGVGFDVNAQHLNDNRHIGINNIKSRLKSMCNGDLKIVSSADKGTKVVISFYKG